MKTSLELLVTNGTFKTAMLDIEEGGVTSRCIYHGESLPAMEPEDPVVILTPTQALQIKHELVTLRQFRGMVHNAVVEIHQRLGGDDR